MLFTLHLIFMRHQHRVLGFYHQVLDADHGDDARLDAHQPITGAVRVDIATLTSAGLTRSRCHSSRCGLKRSRCHGYAP